MLHSIRWEPTYTHATSPDFRTLILRAWHLWPHYPRLAYCVNVLLEEDRRHSFHFYRSSLSSFSWQLILLVPQSFGPSSFVIPRVKVGVPCSFLALTYTTFGGRRREQKEPNWSLAKWFAHLTFLLRRHFEGNRDNIHRRLASLETFHLEYVLLDCTSPP